MANIRLQFENRRDGHGGDRRAPAEWADGGGLHLSRYIITHETRPALNKELVGMKFHVSTNLRSYSHCNCNGEQYLNQH